MIYRCASFTDKLSNYVIIVDMLAEALGRDGAGRARLLDTRDAKMPIVAASRQQPDAA
jgi:hypothetical protein